jgi:hypothetical protein
MTGLIRILLIVFLTGMQINLVASNADTTVRRKFIAIYKTPRSAIFYEVHRSNPLKPVYIIGSIEILNDGFKFIPYEGIEGWPQDLFDKKFALNKGFREIFILYADIKSIKRNGRITLQTGATYRMFGIYRKPWRSTYSQIKAKVPKL